MTIKTKIKNDLWKWNYIIPFVKKYRFYEKGHIFVANKVIHALHTIKPIHGHNIVRSVGDDTKALLSSVNVSIDGGYFVYFIDTEKTIAVPGNIISNFSLDYSKILSTSFNDIVNSIHGDSFYAQEARAVLNGIEVLRKNIINAVRIS